MSTEHIREEAEAARRTLGQLARRVGERRRDVRRELQGLETETDHVLIGARGALRAIDDDREVALEELDQLDEIFDGPDEPEVPAPTPPGPLTPPPAPPWVPPVPPTPPVDDGPVIIAPPPVDDGDDEPDDIVVIRRWWNIRDWSGVQWFLAVIGLILAIIVARFTWEPLVGDDIVGFARGAIATIWWIALMGLGFFGGGFIGSFFNRQVVEVVEEG